MKLRAMWIKEDSKGSLKWPNIDKFRDPNQSTKGSQNAKFEKRRTGRDTAHHGLPVVGARTVVPQPRTAVRPWCIRFFLFFVRLFIFRRFLLCFALIMLMYLDLFNTQFIPNTLPFAFYLHLSFRLVLERERRSGEELRGIHAGLRSRDSRTRFWLSNLFSFSSLFSSLVLYFCWFVLNTRSFDLGLYAIIVNFPIRC